MWKLIFLTRCYRKEARLGFSFSYQLWLQMFTWASHMSGPYETKFFFCRLKLRPYLKLATPVLGCIMLAQGRSKINQLGKGGIISDGIINFYPALKSQDTLNFYFWMQSWGTVIFLRMGPNWKYFLRLHNL